MAGRERTGACVCLGLLAAVAVLVAVAAGSGTAAAAVGGGVQPQVASCTASPTTVAPGERVRLDASASDASVVEFDKEGDGTYERTDDTDFVVNVTYESPGSYDPVARADGETTDPCGTVTVTEPPSASLSISPSPAVTGEQVTFDASASSDPDGSIVAYRWDLDADGAVDRRTNTSVVEFVYSSTGGYPVSVTVVDDVGATDTANRDLVVREPVVARCTVEPSTAAPGETVTLDATGSENAETIDYDTDGDGEYEVLDSTRFTREADAIGRSYTPSVRVHRGERTDTADCGQVTVVTPNEPPVPALSISPRPGVVGRTVTFDASNATDPDGRIVAYQWDFDGDGTTDNTTVTPTTTHTYGRAQTYVPVVTVVDDDGASRSMESEFRVREPRPELRCTVEPRTVAPGEEVLIDARESTGVTVVDYDVDGDGEYERPERTDLATTVTYEEPGTYEPRVRVYAGDRTADCGVVTVERPNEPPTARFTVYPPTATTGASVTFDASNSTDPDGRIVAYRWDFDGDGTVDRTTASPRVRHTYAGTGGYGAVLTVVDDDNATDSTGRDLVVEKGAPDDEPSGSIPWIPVGVGGGLLGLGGLLWYFFGGGGGGGGTTHRPKPKPKPTPGQEGSTRYETGVFALPTASGTVSVPVGFEPDLVLLTAVNGARTDAAIDRTAGGSFGIARRTDEGVRNQCLTVADDARSTDQATCAAAEDLSLHLVRHESSSPPGRVTGRVTDTTSEGFDLDVTIPGDDPLAGGVRVLYQAFRTGSDVDVEAGYFETPTEPGTQTVELGVDADHVSLTASAAVEDTDQLWTTNRSVGLSVGNAVTDPEGRLSQTVWGTSAWPEVEHTTAAVCGVDRALYLLYQDADRIAGRTSATLTGLGSTLRLQYDRVYSGPHKLGSTARHPVSYLAVAGEAMRPAVGAVEFPLEGETRTVDCGFEPAMVELVVTAAPVGAEVAGGATSRPFDVSYGTAIADDDRVRQYVLHHSVVTEPPAARGQSEAGGSGVSGGTGTRGRGRAADGGQPVSPTDESMDRSGSATAPVPDETGDDGRAGLWLSRGPDGTVRGRDELHVTGTSATGFGLTAEGVSTDSRSGNELRPTVVYRAWPAVDAERGSADGSESGAGGSGDKTGAGSPPADATTGGHSAGSGPGGDRRTEGGAGG